MAKEATGELRPLANGFEARIRIEGKRHGFVLVGIGANEGARAAERCKAMAQIASRLTAAGLAPEAEKLLDIAASARHGRPWDNILAAVDALCAGTTGKLSAVGLTVWKDHAADWTSGRLAKKYPDHVRRKQHVEADTRILNRYVNPVLGDLPVKDLRLEDFEQVMARLPEHLRPASRRHVAQVMSKLESLAVYPCRLIAASRIPRGWLPKGTSKLAMQCLRPAEDNTVMACAAVPLIRRLFFGVLAREGPSP